MFSSVPSWSSLCGFFVAAAALVMASCAPYAPRIEPQNLFWPQPPEKPRIRYVQSIYTEDDIGRVYSFKEKLFGKTYDDSLSRPYGVFARNGKVLVTDIVTMRVVVFDFGRKRMQVLEEGRTQVPAAAADVNGTLYVADAAQSRIAVYDEAGTFRTAFMLTEARPVALACNAAKDRLYVVDRAGHKVLVLDLVGKVLFEFGGQGTADGRFNLPLGIALGPDGSVAVLDSGNFRVQIFDADGKFLTKFGSVGDRAGFFSNPKGIAVDSDGHIYVTDAAFSNFQIFDQEGNILLFLGRLGTGPGQLYIPAGISIDENDRIYVADQLNSRIQVFQYLKD